MGNSRWSGSLISGGGIFAAGTTNFNAQAGSAATVLPDGTVRSATYMDAGSYVNAGSYLESTSYVKAGTGYTTGKGDVKQWAAGTYYGIGGATAPITATGLTTIHHVFMNRRRTNYAGAIATTGQVLCSPCIAPGTVGSFYPILFKIAGAAGAIAVNTVAGTFSWYAVGAKTI